MAWSKSSEELLDKINKTIGESRSLLDRVADASERKKMRALTQLRLDYISYSKEIQLMNAQKQIGRTPELTITNEHIQKMRELQNLHSRLKAAYSRPGWAFWWYDGSLTYYF